MMFGALDLGLVVEVLREDEHGEDDEAGGDRDDGRRVALAEFVEAIEELRLGARGGRRTLQIVPFLYRHPSPFEPTREPRNVPMNSSCLRIRGVGGIS